MADELRAAAPMTADGWPVFDVMTLGMGEDGHILSVFPGSAALAATQLAIGVDAPTHIEPHVPRVTLNPKVLAVARALLVIATGEGKAATLADVLGPVGDALRWPSQLAWRDGATWIVTRRRRRDSRDDRSVAGRGRATSCRQPGRNRHRRLSRRRGRTTADVDPRHDRRPHHVPCRGAAVRPVRASPCHRSARAWRLRRHAPLLDRA